MKGHCPYCKQPGPEHEICAEAYAQGCDPKSREDAEELVYEGRLRLGEKLTERLFPGISR